jgi:hypothetical protein
MSSVGEAWKDEDPQDGKPKFGRKAQRWFRARLLQHLRELQVEPALLDALADWYVEETTLYVRWVPATRYSGKGFALGGWELHDDRVLADLLTGLEAVRATVATAAANAFTSLDEWLAADLAGTIPAYGYQLGGSPRLPEALRGKLKSATWRRDLLRPRECPDCHGAWRVRTVQWKVGGVGIAGHDRDAKRCHECRKADRTTKHTTKQKAVRTK